MSIYEDKGDGRKTHSIVADPAKVEKRRVQWQKEMQRKREAVAGRVERAKGRTIVRTYGYRGGNCQWLGDLVRETDHFYIFEPPANPHPLFRNRTRISKKKAHIVPCKSCVDHPEFNPQLVW